MLTNLHQNLGAAMCVICSLVSVLHCPLHLIIQKTIHVKKRKKNLYVVVTRAKQMKTSRRQNLFFTGMCLENNKNLSIFERTF